MNDIIAQTYLTEMVNPYSLTTLENPDHLEQATNLAVNEFSKHLNNDVEKTKEYLSAADPKLSRGVMHKGKMVGAYFLTPKNIPNSEVSPEFQSNYEKDILNKQGIEGIGLVVHPDHRGSGVGKMLKSYASNIPNHDYIWGSQLHSLNNIHHWLKTRKMIGNHLDRTPPEYTTYQKL